MAPHKTTTKYKVECTLRQPERLLTTTPEILQRGEEGFGDHPPTYPLPALGTHVLGIPDTSLSGRSTRTARSVRRSNSAPIVARMLEGRRQRRGAEEWGAGSGEGGSPGGRGRDGLNIRPGPSAQRLTGPSEGTVTRDTLTHLGRAQRLEVALNIY